MAPKKRRKRRAPREPGDPRISRVKGPKSRLQPLFKLLREVTDTADLRCLDTEDPQDDVVRLQITVFLRGINALKSIGILNEAAHWEYATPAVRQLFELAVNHEYLERQPDPSASAFRYAKFGLLQVVRGQLATFEYERKTGRAVDEDRVVTLQQLLASGFDEFRRVDKRGRTRWLTTWSGKSTRELAALSSHPLRVSQYELMFRAWSEQAHASPRALLDALPRPGGEKWLEDAVVEDDLRVHETIAMSIVLFIELWSLLPRLPQLDIEQSRRWRAAIVAQAPAMGAPPAVSPRDWPGVIN